MALSSQGKERILSKMKLREVGGEIPLCIMAFVKEELVLGSVLRTHWPGVKPKDVM